MDYLYDPRFPTVGVYEALLAFVFCCIVSLVRGDAVVVGGDCRRDCRCSGQFIQDGTPNSLSAQV